MCKKCKLRFLPPGGVHVRSIESSPCINACAAPSVGVKNRIVFRGDVVNLHLQVYVHVVLVDVARSTSGLLDAAAKCARTRQMDATSVGSEMVPLMPLQKKSQKIDQVGFFLYNIALFLLSALLRKINA